MQQRRRLGLHFRHGRFRDRAVVASVGTKSGIECRAEKKRGAGQTFWRRPASAFYNALVLAISRGSPLGCRLGRRTEHFEDAFLDFNADPDAIGHDDFVDLDVVLAALAERVG